MNDTAAARETPPPLVRTAAVEQFAGEVHAAFERAAGACGLVAGSFELAGRRLGVRLAGDALAGWALPALAHRRAAFAPEDAELTVDVFDSASTGVAIPRPPWPNAAYTPQSEIAGVEGDRFTVAFNVGTGTLDLFDRERRRALHWIADAATHPAWDVSSPFRLVLHWWLRDTGIQLLHAGAVGSEVGAVLLAGKGGAGKSTLALAALAEGMAFAGDDYVLATTEPRVLNLYRSAKLAVPNLMQRLPGFEPLVHRVTEPKDGGKAILMLSGGAAARIADSLPLCALVIPRIAPGPTALRTATTAEALASLVPSNARQLTAVRRADLDRIASLARDLPAHVLTLGEDLHTAVATLRDLARGTR